MTFPTFSSAESTSPIDDGGKEMEENYEYGIESTNVEYEGDNPSNIVKLQTRARRIRNYENLLTDKQIS
jgi:hypothetical protein